MFREPAWVSTAEDVILHKLYWNTITPSDRQVGDAAGVVAVQGKALDRDYLQRWAQEIGVQSLLEDLLSEKKVQDKLNKIMNSTARRIVHMLWLAFWSEIF